MRKENEVYTFKELAADKMPVGKHDKDKTPFTSNTFDLQKGDIVYTLTDGYPDQFGGPKEKKFMYKQLKEIVIANADQTMEEQQVRLSRKFNNWKKDLEQVDDVLIIGVKI